MNTYSSYNTPLNRNLYGMTRNKYSKKQTVTYTKEQTVSFVEQIEGFTKPEQLYYYLTWTNKMQAIDGEFIEYTLRNKQPGNIAIFNTELHHKSSNKILYVVAVEDVNFDIFKWKMSGLLTDDQIFQIYNINKNDLPKGSRAKHSYFQSSINEHYNELISLKSTMSISNLKKIPYVHSQQFKEKKVGRPQFDIKELNKAIKQSIDDICNYKLSLIPILRINTKKSQIKCEVLIPIKLPNKPKWIAISYKISKLSSEITSLYIDPQDIINKSALIDPNTIHQFQWLKGDAFINKTNVSMPTMNATDSLNSVHSVQSTHSSNSIPSMNSTNSMFSVNSINSMNDVPSMQNISNPVITSTININTTAPVSNAPNLPNIPTMAVQDDQIKALQQKLIDALRRETMWILMLQQKDQQIQQLHSLMNNNMNNNNTTNTMLPNINITTTQPILYNNLLQIPVVPLIQPTPNNNNNNNNNIPSTVPLTNNLSASRSSSTASSTAATCSSSSSPTPISMSPGSTPPLPTIPINNYRQIPSVTTPNLQTLITNNSHPIYRNIQQQQTPLPLLRPTNTF